ncbi:MAG TPA: hypothetical protein VIT45_05360 [Allosphingosinicella sp.]
MIAPRPALAALLAAGLVLPGLGAPAPVRAQAAPNAACAAGSRLLNQQGADKQAAESAWRLHWARSNPDRLARYRQSLRAAIAAGRLAPEFDRIAEDLLIPVNAVFGDGFKVASQQNMLRIADELAASVPAGSRPIPADPAAGQRLRDAVARTNQLYQATSTAQLTARCYDSPQTTVASNAASGGGTALYSRGAAAVPISGSEASAPQVCAETKAVLVQLEREERQARDALRRPPPSGETRADVELRAERARFQADLRRQRMTDLKCASLNLPAVEPFARRDDPVTVQGARPSAPNSAVVCAETKNLLPSLEARERDAYLLRWAVDDNYHDPVFASVGLRDAIAAKKVADDFDRIAELFGMDPDSMSKAQKLAAQPGLRRQIIALAARVRAMTGRELNSFINPEDSYDPAQALLESEDDDMPAVPPAVQRKEQEIEQNYLQAYNQAELRRQRLKDLNCDALPTSAVASDNGSLGRVSTRLKQDWGPPEHHYSYGDDWAEMIFIGDPPDRRRVRWTWSGVPGSLNPGDEFTINIAGRLDFKPPGSERGANVSAFVSGEGLIPIREENAYFYQGASRAGTYKYQVPRDAKKVVILLSADNNLGHFMRYCYGQCSP